MRMCTQVYIGLSEDADSGHMEWRLDFSTCGLVVLNMQILVQAPPSPSDEVDGQERLAGEVDFVVRGDEVFLTPQLGGELVRELATPTCSLATPI